MVKELRKLANDLDALGELGLADRVDAVLESRAANTEEATNFMGMLQQVQSHVATAHNAISQLKGIIDQSAAKQAERFTPQQNNNSLQNMRSLTNATYQLNQLLKTQ